MAPHADSYRIVFGPLPAAGLVNCMSENRELTMDDYLAMLLRRLKVILILALFAPLAGFLVSYAFPPRYTSTAKILVEGQKVPDTLVTSVITADFAQRVQTLGQEVLSPGKVRSMIERLALSNPGLIKPGEENNLVEWIQPPNITLEPIPMSAAANAAGISGAKKKASAGDESVPGFNVNYTDSNPERAQKICEAMTEAIVDANLKLRGDTAKGTTDFLGRQVDAAKATLDEQEKELADFKKKHMGHLPTDADNNARMLASLNTQLDATTQSLSRAQQDKTYAESMLAQQVAAWKTSQSSTNPQTLEQELTQLQGQLMQLQARYTDDHPDVIKTKADIAEVEKKLKEATAATASATDSSDKASASEPPEIRQLRLQIHQYQSVIEQDALDQKRLQSSINLYQSFMANSPE